MICEMSLEKIYPSLLRSVRDTLALSIAVGVSVCWGIDLSGIYGLAYGNTSLT